jgi:hypothetical protein
MYASHHHAASRRAIAVRFTAAETIVDSASGSGMIGRAARASFPQRVSWLA